MPRKLSLTRGVFQTSFGTQKSATARQQIPAGVNTLRHRLKPNAPKQRLPITRRRSCAPGLGKDGVLPPRGPAKPEFAQTPGTAQEPKSAARHVNKTKKIRKDTQSLEQDVEGRQGPDPKRHLHCSHETRGPPRHRERSPQFVPVLTFTRLAEREPTRSHHHHLFPPKQTLKDKKATVRRAQHPDLRTRTRLLNDLLKVSARQRGLARIIHGANPTAQAQRPPCERGHEKRSEQQRPRGQEYAQGRRRKQRADHSPNHGGEQGTEERAKGSGPRRKPSGRHGPKSTTRHHLTVI